MTGDMITVVVTTDDTVDIDKLSSSHRNEAV
jgi:hypothetical protein